MTNDWRALRRWAPALTAVFLLLSVSAQRATVAAGFQDNAGRGGGVSQHPDDPTAGSPGGLSNRGHDTSTHMVDISVAGDAELETLDGIGPAEAKRIIDGRPYHAKKDLLARKILPEKVYLKIANHIRVGSPAE